MDIKVNSNELQESRDFKDKYTKEIKEKDIPPEGRQFIQGYIAGLQAQIDAGGGLEEPKANVTLKESETDPAA